MKTTIPQLMAVGATTLLAGAMAHAQDNLRAGEPYISAGVGPVFQQNLYIRNAGRSVALDTGARGEVSAGFNVTDNFAVELQTAGISSQIRSDTLFGGNRAYLEQVPLLANAIFKAPLQYGITPYIGVGAGGVVNDLSVRTNGHWTDDADATFAYQGMAGVTVAFAKHFDVGLGYRFMGTPDHTFFRDDPTMYTPTGKILTHAVVATFTFSF